MAGNSTNYNAFYQFGNSTLHQPYQLALSQHVYQYVEEKRVNQVNEREFGNYFEGFYIALEHKVEKV